MSLKCTKDLRLGKIVFKKGDIVESFGPQARRRISANQIKNHFKVIIPKDEPKDKIIKKDK